MNENKEMERLLTQPLRFEYQAGGIVRLDRSHCTGWRSLPCLMLSLAASGSETIEFADGRGCEAGTNAMIILPAGIRHRVSVTSTQEVRIWAHINYFVLDSQDLFSFLEIPAVLPPEATGAIGELLQIPFLAPAETATLQDGLRRVAETNAFGFRLLALLAPFCRLRESAVNNLERQDRFRPVLEYMARNLDKPLTRDCLAKRAHLSTATFHVVFKQAFGKPPMHFLEDMRLREAQSILLRESVPVMEIAARCGYSDQFVFSKAFRRSFGMAPSDYRRNIQPVTGEIMAPE